MASVELYEVLDKLDSAIQESGGVPALAKKWRVSPSYIYMVKNEDVTPSRKMLKRLGFDIQKQYVRVNV